MTLDTHNYSRKSPNRKHFTILFIILAVIAVPSSIVGIYDIFDIMPIDKKCETGIKQNWYKNCEYKFQFDLPTDSWDIYDVNDERIIVGGLDNIGTQYWLSYSYVYGDNFTSDAFGSLRIIDMHGLWSDSFNKFNQMIVASFLNDTVFIDLEHTASENGKFEMSYQLKQNEKIFSCVDRFIKKVSLIYSVRMCINEDSADFEYFYPNVFSFWKSFRFF